MPFDEDPRDSIESYPCDICKTGNIMFNQNTGCWECDHCDFAANNDNGI